MNKRPVSVLLIGWLYITTGILGLINSFTEFLPQHRFSSDLVWVLLVRLLAVIAGVYLLQGRNWARWLALLWILYHVALSVFHSWQEVILHGLLAAAVAFILFRPPSAQYFKEKKQ